MSFVDSFKFAYNTTIESTPGLGMLYEKIPVLSNEEALRAGLMRLKTVLTMWRNLDSPKSVSFIREISRAAPNLIAPIIKKNCPELEKILNPRGGKVPRTYLGKVFAQNVSDVEAKLAKQIMAEIRKALPKVCRALLGLDAEGAKLVMENVLSKSSRILAKSPEVEWAWLAGWVGLILGSLAYATMDEIQLNQAIQGAAQYFFRYWYGIDVTDADTRRMEAVVMRRKLAALKNAVFGESERLGIEVPQVTINQIKALIQQLHDAEAEVGSARSGPPPARQVQDAYEDRAFHGSRRAD